MIKNSMLMITVAAAMGLTVGCERAQTGESAQAPQNGAVIPAGLFATLPVADAKSVVDAKASAKEGETVLVRGRIGGSRSPFVDNRAMFTIVDASMLACSDTPGDGCKTPWDYCCEQPADIAEHAATIRLNGPDGSVLRASLKGAGGLRELSTVVVRGIVTQADGAVLVIDADAIDIDSVDTNPTP
jgi:hypothetical protein